MSGVCSILLGMAFGAVMMYAAWEGSPDGEIHSDGNIHWIYWFEIGLSNFIVVSVCVFVAFGIIPAVCVELWSRLKRRDE